MTRIISIAINHNRIHQCATGSTGTGSKTRCGGGGNSPTVYAGVETGRKRPEIDIDSPRRNTFIYFFCMNNNVVLVNRPCTYTLHCTVCGSRDGNFRLGTLVESITKVTIGN